MKLETRRTVVISMSHLRASTAAAIFAAPANSLPYMAAPLGDSEIIAYAHTANDGADPIPADLWAVMTWARAETMVPGSSLPEDPGFEYVILDRDAEPVDGLPIYDGEVARAPTAFDRTRVKLGDYLRITVPLDGGDNNSEESTVPAGEVWQVEHVNNAGPGSFCAVHPSGVTATFDAGDADPLPIEAVVGEVFSCNVRAMCHLTATRYIEATNEDHAASLARKAAKRDDFVWDRSDPEGVQFESMN